MRGWSHPAASFSAQQEQVLFHDDLYQLELKWKAIYALSQPAKRLARTDL
jgi:hypothetical protein